MSEKAFKILKEHGPAPVGYLSQHYSKETPQKLAYIFRNHPKCGYLNKNTKQSRKVWYFKEDGSGEE